MMRPAAVVLDIEGTVAPVAFVHDVLFPFAQARMAAWCDANPDDALVAAVALAVPGVPVADTLLGWMAQDEKVTALKAVQGRIWAEGYRSGEIVGQLYQDVAPALRRWARAGLKLFVYSSGSVEAQRLLFGHTADGDVTNLFQGFFDTRVGMKREEASYALIARGANLSAGETLFLSDVEAELDAAAACGMLTCQLVRPADGTVATTRHAVAADLELVATQFGLPRAG